MVKAPVGTLTYTIVLTGHLNAASPQDSPAKQQFHDIVDIHRVLKVSTTMFRVPKASDADCGRACGDDWEMRLLKEFHASQVAQCGSDPICSHNFYQEHGNLLVRRRIVSSLQRLAKGGPVWSRMQPCTATLTVNDNETLTRYVYADEAGTDEDPGLVTNKGNRTGSVKDADCDEVLDTNYALYLGPKDIDPDVPGYDPGYVFQLPPFSIPVVLNRYGNPPEDGGFAGAIYSKIRDNAIRLGHIFGPSLPRPVAGQPYSGKRHIDHLFKAMNTPVFHQNRPMTVSADISWRFMPVK
ncbi:MAG TPA: hypothetical protein VFL54_05190 [Gammaproteobacteria bacterium]|nr:hypothetical protein [Gammaproteobacteria bacterium]